MRLLAGREARRCVCCMVQSSNTWGLKQLVFCYKLLIREWICEMSFSLSQRKTVTGLCKAEWIRTNFRLATQGPQHGVRWDERAESRWKNPPTVSRSGSSYRALGRPLDSQRHKVCHTRDLREKQKTCLNSQSL